MNHQGSLPQYTNSGQQRANHTNNNCGWYFRFPTFYLQHGTDDCDLYAVGGGGRPDRNQWHKPEQSRLTNRKDNYRGHSGNRRNQCVWCDIWTRAGRRRRRKYPGHRIWRHSFGSRALYLHLEQRRAAHQPLPTAC
jgi:hypothetical protein